MTSHSSPLTTKEIFRRWWPLAASWLLMGAELPFVSAIVARLANPEINLAAYGGVVFPLALIIESPIIMLLAASTALSKDWLSYKKLQKFMMVAGAVLTLLHTLVAFTPLYYWVVEHVIGAPQEVVEPARLGLMIMVPWSWAIAFRRFQQGVLIRFDHSRAVTVGTMIRLAGIASVLTAGYLIQSIPGVIVAAAAVITGVVGEAIYAGWRVRPVIQNQLKTAQKVQPELTFREFAKFYTPLALTSLLTLIAQPIGSAALSRMPNALESLAAWPVVNGLIFLLSCVGFSYQELVVTLLDKPNAFYKLRDFAAKLALIGTAALAIVTITPIGKFWFEGASGLSPTLTGMALVALWLGLLRPGFLVVLFGLQGALVHSRRTRPITEAIALSLTVSSLILWLGVLRDDIIGLYVGVAAFTIGVVVQVLWLWLRGRSTIIELKKRHHPDSEIIPTGTPAE
jgi:hypothetical protein